MFSSGGPAPLPSSQGGQPTTSCPLRCRRHADTLLGGGCSDGDKNYTFASNAYTSATLPANRVLVTIFSTGDSHTLDFLALGLWKGSGSLAYSVAVNNTSTDLLSTISASQATSETGSTFTGNLTASDTNPGTCGSSIPVSSWSCATSPLTYPSGVTTSNVTNTWNSPMGMTQMGNTITQGPVPGPLPLLGAATALGLSRKLRKRIKASA